MGYTFLAEQKACKAQKVFDRNTGSHDRWDSVLDRGLIDQLERTTVLQTKTIVAHEISLITNRLQGFHSTQ